MTAVLTTEPASPGAPLGPAGAAPVAGQPVLPQQRPAEVRGDTHVAPRVYAKIAGCAASEVAGVLPVERRGLGHTAETRPAEQASASVGPEGVDITLGLAVRYPEPVWQVTAAVRQHVVDRILALTGTPVRSVTLDVEQLRRPVRERRRVQ